MDGWWVSLIVRLSVAGTAASLVNVTLDVRYKMTKMSNSSSPYLFFFQAQNAAKPVFERGAPLGELTTLPRTPKLSRLWRGIPSSTLLVSIMLLKVGLWPQLGYCISCVVWNCRFIQDSLTARDHNFSQHVIFILCAGSYSHEIGLVNFVRPLRTSSLFTHRLRDIIFYTDPALVDAEWKTIANFPRLFVYPVRVSWFWVFTTSFRWCSIIRLSSN